MNFELQKINTRDGLILDGLFFNPKKGSGKAALFIHGFPGNFYLNSEIINNLADEFGKYNLGLLSLNTRGHDIINITFKKSGKAAVLGAAFERFEDCPFDIEAGIKFLNSKEFKEIILIGTSGGADKVGFYLSEKPDKSVKGVIFLSPGSNISIIQKELKRKYKPLLEKSFYMVKRGKGDKLALEPELEFPVSWQRFISLYSEQSNENIFPFHNKKSEFKLLSKIKVPVLIVAGGKDEYFHDYKIEELIEILKRKMKKVQKFNAEIIKTASHRFTSKEKELAKIIRNWIRNI
ncbi:MAG TPA: hypothetical protein DHV62_07880 [Elusimicrobia bacterium]|nr:hypothetical protein [Elusimicrobiota bacterium]